MLHAHGALAGRGLAAACNIVSEHYVMFSFATFELATHCERLSWLRIGAR